MTITLNTRTICLFTILLFCHLLFARVVRDTTITGKDTVVICSTYAKAGYLRSVYKKENGQFHGIYKSWHKNGKLKSVTKYNEGESTDTSYSYYKSGKLESIGLKNGKWFRLFENGDTAVVGYSKNGKPFSLRRVYFSNSKIKEKQNYKSGQKHGLCETWFTNGARQDSVVYKDGVTIVARHYYTNGKVRYYKSKCKDALIFEAVYYDPSGKKTGEVKNGNGKYIIYAEDGSIPAEEVVKNGKVVSSKELKKE